MTNAPESPRRLALRRLNRATPTPVSYVPDASTISEIATQLGLLGLRKARLTGVLTPEGRHDWQLEATAGGTAVQPCSVTLAPVTTRVDDPVLRVFVADYSDPTETEAEMPDDDHIEPLPDHLDLAQILAEVLALALPDFPRASDAALDQSTFAPPGADLDAKDAPPESPFQALAALKPKTDD